MGESVAEKAVMRPGQEQGSTVALGGDAVAVAVRDPFDEAVVSQPAQVVGSLPAAEGSRSTSEERFEVFS